MLLRPKLAGLFSALAASAALLLSGCSSSSPRDRNYGTDVGVGFVPPDVAPTTWDSAATDGAASEAGGSSDSGDALDAKVSTDSADGGVDAEGSLDASDAFIDGAD